MNQSLSIDVESINHRRATHPEKTAILAKEINKKKQEVSDAFRSNTFLGVLAGISSLYFNAQITPAKFTCFFNCKNCGGDVSATGTSQIPVANKNQTAFDVPSLKVEYFSPPVPIFNIDSAVPTTVKEEVLQSFNHFHSDLSSSGAKLRKSVEKICSELGFNEKNLHCSISSMEKHFPEEASLLHSLKLLGNEATHSDSVNEDDLLDAFEVQEFVLGVFKRRDEKKKISDTANKLKLKFDKIR